jgi:hypothetical protein
MRCRTKFCRGITTDGGHSPYCGKCRNRRWKAKSPLKYAFAKLRNRAKERGHSFSLTFAEYEKFAIQTGYAELKGKTKYSLSIDRRDPSRGYHSDNIRAVSLSLNTRLQWANIPAWLKEEMVEAERQALSHRN